MEERMDWLSPMWFFAPLIGFILGMILSLVAIYWL